MAFILTSIAGLATLLGVIPIFFKVKKTDLLINISLSFAIGVMLSVSFFDLLPEAMELINVSMYPKVLFVLISINIGIIITLFIDKMVPNSNDLYRVGVISAVALIIHNIPEGMATYISSTHNMHLGLSLSLAIALHNIPEGIMIAVPIYYATGSKLKSFIYTFISGISEVIGALIVKLFIPSINSFMMGLLLCIITGIMSYISIFELYPLVKKYHYKVLSIISIIVGILVMVISIIVINRV